VASDQDYRASPRFTTDRSYWLERLADMPGPPVRVAGGAPSAAEDIIPCSSYLTPAAIADLKGEPQDSSAAAPDRAGLARRHNIHSGTPDRMATPSCE